MRLGEMFEVLQDDHAHRKLAFKTEIIYTEDTVKTMPELESWFTGLAFVLLSEKEYGRRLEVLEHTEAGQIAWQFQAVVRGLMVAGPIARGHPPCRTTRSCCRSSNAPWTSSSRTCGAMACADGWKTWAASWAFSKAWRGGCQSRRRSSRHRKRRHRTGRSQ